MLSPKWILSFLTGIAAIAAIYYSFRVYGPMRSFFLLRDCAPAQVERWEILDEQEDRSKIKAFYAFSSQGENWQGSYIFESEYLNRYAALAALKNLTKRPQMSWHDCKKPNESSLVRRFPLNLFLRAFVSLSLSIYFFYLINKISYC